MLGSAAWGAGMKPKRDNSLSAARTGVDVDALQEVETSLMLSREVRREWESVLLQAGELLRELDVSKELAGDPDPLPSRSLWRSLFNDLQVWQEQGRRLVLEVVRSWIDCHRK
jgi:hypothetical protein